MYEVCLYTGATNTVYKKKEPNKYHMNFKAKWSHTCLKPYQVKCFQTDLLVRFKILHEYLKNGQKNTAKNRNSGHLDAWLLNVLLWVVGYELPW